MANKAWWSSSNAAWLLLSVSSVLKSTLEPVFCAFSVGATSSALSLVLTALRLLEVDCSSAAGFVASTLRSSTELASDFCTLSSVVLVLASSIFAAATTASAFAGLSLLAASAVTVCVLVFWLLSTESRRFLAAWLSVICSTASCLSAFFAVLSSWLAFCLSASLIAFSALCFSGAWRVAATDLLSSKDKCTTSGDLSSVDASLTCNTTSLGSWLRRALDWLLPLPLLVSLLLCSLFALNVSPRSILPREERWLFDLRLARVCSSIVLASFLAASLCSVLLLSCPLRPLSWRLLRLRSLERRLSCWRLSWLSACLSSVPVERLSSTLLLAALPLDSSDCSFLWRVLEGLDLRDLRLLLSSASLLSSVLLLAACWRLVFGCCSVFCWLLAVCGAAAAWVLASRALLSICPNEPRLWAPVFTSASMASAASRLLTLGVVDACGAWANRLDNQATACGWAAVALLFCEATGAAVVATVGAFCDWVWGWGARVVALLALALALLRWSLLWLVVFFCWLLARGVVWLFLLLPLSAAWRGWRVGCCSGRTESAVCQSTL